MSTTRFFLTAFLTVGMAANGGLGIEIEQLNTSFTEGPDWVHDVNGVITIRADSQADTYVFWAHTGDGQTLAAIPDIIKDPTLTSGTVKVRISKSLPGSALIAGATELKAFSIGDTALTTELNGVSLTGDLLATAAATVDSVTGDIIFGDGGNNVLVNDLTIENDLEAEIRVKGALSHKITVKGDVTTAGSIYVEGHTWNTGDILIEGSLIGDVTLDDYVGSGLNITVNSGRSGGGLQPGATAAKAIIIDEPGNTQITSIIEGIHITGDLLLPDAEGGT